MKDCCKAWVQYTHDVHDSELQDIQKRHEEELDLAIGVALRLGEKMPEIRDQVVAAVATGSRN